MTDDIILQVNTLGKCFKIYANPWHRALEWARFGKRTYHQPFWALQDISFEVKRGEFFGIIGQNGAGKSTLLKILSGVLPPTSGTYQVNGRALSMLELGMDFNPYLTGCDNVFHSTELLGFPDGYVQARLEQIREFSELGDFFDRPVRLYSTGMTARLAFSIYAFLECDILILDEVLAVGDLFFRQKCYACLEELIANNTTIILVTHDLGVVQHYCNHVLILHKGQKMYEGESQQALPLYHQLRYDRSPDTFLRKRYAASPVTLSLSSPNKGSFWPPDDVLTSIFHIYSSKARLTRFAICDQKNQQCVDFNYGEQIFLYCEFQVYQNIGIPVIGVRITNQFNVVVHAKNSLQFARKLPLQVQKGQYIRTFRSLELKIQPGEYVVNFGLRMIDPDDYADLEELAADVNFWRHQVSVILEHHKIGYFKIHWNNSNIPHFGICDLPGDHQICVVSEAECTYTKEALYS